MVTPHLLLEDYRNPSLQDCRSWLWTGALTSTLLTLLLAMLATWCHSGFMCCLFFDHEEGGDISQKCWMTLSGLHGVTSQNSSQ
jgi:hypothetical protein